MQEQERLAILREKVPGLFAPQKKLLYVGATPQRMQCGMALAGLYEITLLEIWPAYAQAYMPGSLNPLASLVSHVIVGDVREVDQLELPYEHYDVAFWWHGPSHIPEEDLAPTLEKLEALADLVVLGSPWGRYDQPPVDGNPHQAHASSLYPEMFEAVGYTTVAMGQPDVRGSCITAWKVIGEIHSNIAVCDSNFQFKRRRKKEEVECQEES